MEIALGNPVVLISPNNSGKESHRPANLGPVDHWLATLAGEAVGAPEPGPQTARGHHQAPEPAAPLFPILTQSMLWLWLDNPLPSGDTDVSRSWWELKGA